MVRSYNNLYHGWINLYKDSGLTSNDALRLIKSIFKGCKIGHAGTLDPMAKGILPIALGEATKTVPYIHEKNKTYLFAIKFGEQTDTDDATGKIIGKSDRKPDIEQIKSVLHDYVGPINQIPPIYSAKKFNGIRSYELARKGVVPDLFSKAKTVHLENIKWVEMNSDFECTIEVTCGTGTYIRSISKHIGVKLDLCCHVSRLERTRYGPFNLKNILSIDRLMQLNHDIDNLNMIISPIETVLDDILAVQIDNHDANRLRNGSTITFGGNNNEPQLGRVVAKSADKLIAICSLKDTQLQPIRVFNL
ncbi:MAG: tRNA pseudouridine(55) synthase TruB [Pseudomonadota bacterium]|nr:tRNA pseudouridine(55) synthase TruB [Pseudomonadota bacterium]